MSKDCPQCGENSVTLDPNEGTILGHPIEDFILRAENDEELGITAYCWECGWETKKNVSIKVLQ